ncbi:MAG: hypothetical protein ACHQFZ_09140 [Acidimicrobiales bacterium]
MEDRLTTQVDDAVGGLAQRARQTLWFTQSFFFLALAVCWVIYHGHVAGTDGISYYGVYPPTMPMLFAGYLTAAGGLWLTSGLVVDAGAPALMRLAFRVIAVGMVVLLATPYNQGTFLNWAHMVTGVTIAATQVPIAVALVRRRPNLSSFGAFAVLLVGGVLGAISLPDWHIPLLLQGECLLEVGFAWSLIEWTYELGSRRR